MTMNDNRSHTLALLSMLDGQDAVYDFRALHDRDKGAEGIALRGTFAQCEAQLTALNANSYGIHVMINRTDGAGRLRDNIAAVRAQLLDLDGVDSAQQLQRVLGWSVPPHAVVNTSGGKYQVWWRVTEHVDKQLYVDNQRRLIGEFNGDPQFIDVAHTARLPGFYHCKGTPSLVTISAGPAWNGGKYDAWAISAPLLHVPLIGANASDRKPLGHAAWAAPSLEWLQYALWKIDPNSLRRSDWIAVTAATKQAGWSFGEDAVRSLWEKWCAFYADNDQRENNKQWGSIDATGSGWQALVQRSGIAGDLLAAGVPAAAGAAVSPAAAGAAGDAAALGSFLTAGETAQYMAGCVWITSEGRILGPNGRLMDQNKFNGLYGGKTFILDDAGSLTTRSPWDAALKGAVWSVQKVDHMRFVPRLETGAVLYDEFGMTGVNTYRKPVTKPVAGDVQPFLDHLQKLVPLEHDRAVVLAFLAQCVQRPGVKIKWALVLQSMEGAGKTIFEQVMQAALGISYVYSPAPRELTEGGGKFNGWMRNKLMILINEIKTDEKRELIEVMKPWITEYRIEMQNKGADQQMSDNPTNFLMFTNYKDAVPVNASSRRYAIVFSQIQKISDLQRLEMTGNYFSNLYRWSTGGGASAVAEWLMRYPVPPELDSEINATRAPETSATLEAIALSRGWLEQVIQEAIEGNRQGFRGGWVSTVAVGNLLREYGHKMPGPRVIPNALTALGFEKIGRASKVYAQEFSTFQTTLYNLRTDANLSEYGIAQGYEF